MFEPIPKARASFVPGTLYAITGEDGWIYYGQVDLEKSIGFFHVRHEQLAAPADVLSQPIISRIGVIYSSVGEALRKGHWKLMGRHSIHNDLLTPPQTVQWPVGTLTVTVWLGAEPAYETRVEDPAIQNLEIIAGWDAIYHLPGRLKADFDPAAAEWFVGGPIWRERYVREERARRSPNQPWDQLPADWVWTGITPKLD
ncbi:hypothetical protein [Andreprevotia chitinilytica]|uniref:hypothetical protein n=1 Tax=Andreprevotia chitinilytica TaxID=396808 RepID=UPI000A04C38C|nr:hypothetical protein [Andreprevotia chitinilytica]